MITKETTIHIGNYEIRFTVYDDGDIYAVTIASKLLGMKVVSSSQKLNWNKMLASVINKLWDIIPHEAVKDLINKLQESDAIDQGFMKYI